jgi:glycosyltransferase involved in cell wall biosynthesis
MTKKILIVNGGPIYPVEAMNQMRTHNMIRSLSKDFSVGLLTPYVDHESLDASHKALQVMEGEYISLKSVKHKKNIFKKRAVQSLEYFNYIILGIDREVTANKWNNKEIIRIIKEKGYRIVISNYWEASLYFRDLGDEIYKILDPHYAVCENIDILNKGKNSGVKYFLEKRRLSNNIKMEREVIAASDLLLPLSVRNQEEFLKIAPGKPMLQISDGADLEHYLSYHAKPDPRTILFYGAMGSAQNRGAFRRFYYNIFPQLKTEFPDIRLIVVGSRPSEEIKALHDSEKVIVTGFVEDVRPWLSQAWFTVIPLELGSGFRGRVIELMAMGIPVVGTHNALDSIPIETGKHGFVSDSNEELTSYCFELIKNPDLRHNISLNAKDFVKVNYSLESTFGKLREHLKSKFPNGSN